MGHLESVSSHSLLYVLFLKNLSNIIVKLCNMLVRYSVFLQWILNDLYMILKSKDSFQHSYHHYSIKTAYCCQMQISCQK